MSATNRSQQTPTPHIDWSTPYWQLEPWPADQGVTEPADSALPPPAAPETAVGIADNDLPAGPLLVAQQPDASDHGGAMRPQESAPVTSSDTSENSIEYRLAALPSKQGLPASDEQPSSPAHSEVGLAPPAMGRHSPGKRKEKARRKAAEPRHLAADPRYRPVLWGLAGFIVGVGFWHAVGFWSFVSAVLVPPPESRTIHARDRLGPEQYRQPDAERPEPVAPSPGNRRSADPARPARPGAGLPPAPSAAAAAPTAIEDPVSPQTTAASTPLATKPLNRPTEPKQDAALPRHTTNIEPSSQSSATGWAASVSITPTGR